jgi:hypothetical protein
MSGDKVDRTSLCLPHSWALNLDQVRSYISIFPGFLIDRWTHLDHVAIMSSWSPTYRGRGVPHGIVCFSLQTFSF